MRKFDIEHVILMTLLLLFLGLLAFAVWMAYAVITSDMPEWLKWLLVFK